MKMMPTAVRNPSPGKVRPRIRPHIGVKTSSMRLQKIHRSHAVRNAGTVTKKPAMKRTLSQFRTLKDMQFEDSTSRQRRRYSTGALARRRGARARRRIRGAAPLGRGDPAAAHHAQKIAEGREAHEGIAALLVADRRGRAAVVVAGEQDRVVG